MSASYTTDNYYRPAEFRVGGILQRALELTAQRALTLFPIAIVLLAPLLWFEHQLLVLPIRSHGRVPIGFGDALYTNVAQSLFEALVIYAVFQYLRGRTVGIGETMGLGLRRALPVLGTALIVGIATGIGLVFFIIPGLLVSVACAVANPACVVEGLNPIDSIGRSWELTKGYRWSVFGMYVVIGIAGMLASGVIAAWQHPETASTYLILQYVESVVFTTYGAVVSVIIYHDLRVVKEGVDIDQIAAVFD
ncbi:MAG TPA: hypothetical protein VFB22_05595 [Candidatus Baltobacteraceae bacterium]|nr:hypothetical protein [Candidatus Baltobacteraceae bacterium]